MDNKNKTRFCEKCGNQIKNGDRFCEHCGAEIKPLPMTSVNEKPTDIKSDKKSKKKLVVIISVVSAIAIVLAVCAIVLCRKSSAIIMPSKLLKQPPNRLQRKFRQPQSLQLLNRC